MKVAIIGAGWVGCHISKKLKELEVEFTLFEEKDIFSSTSFYNQNRLHLGFHYSRNQRTRNLCKDTFSKFIEEYGEIVKEVPLNIYSIPTKSIIDFGTYTSILKHEEIKFYPISIEGLENIEGSINTEEKYIDFKLIKEYFSSLLSDHLVNKKIEDIESLYNEYDYVINCTNNFIKNEEIPAYYEVSLSLVYEKIKDPGFDSITLVDGNFFSIYPYKENLFTLTDVEYTPMFTNNSLGEIKEFRESINNKMIDSIKGKIVERVKFYFPNFDEHYVYQDYFISIKSKTHNQSADRYPIISTNGKLINCFTGKIQGIYVIEDEIKRILNL